MKDRGRGSYREPMKGYRAGKEAKRVSLDAGGMQKTGGGGTISKEGWKGRGKSSSDYGKAGPGKGPKGTRTGPGRRAPKGQSHNGFREPS